MDGWMDDRQTDRQIFQLNFKFTQLLIVRTRKNLCCTIISTILISNQYSICYTIIKCSRWNARASQTF